MIIERREQKAWEWESSLGV